LESERMTMSNLDIGLDTFGDRSLDGDGATSR
jgi:hypothetical protein